MVEASNVNGSLSDRKYRNTSSLISSAALSFETAHIEGIMALYVQPNKGRTVKLPESGTNIVDFVRCSYLGLDNHPLILEGALQGIKDANTLHWSCARTRLNFYALGALEETLSSLFDAQIITFTTVLAANMSALPLLASGHLTEGVKPVVVFDQLAHATLAYHKATVAAETRVETIAHNDIAQIEQICMKNPCVAYVCDGVYSMGGHAPIQELLRLQEQYGLFLYIDDAHGISLFGENGEGFAKSQIPDLGSRTIIAASLGKGFGASGGILMLGTALQEILFRRFAIAHAFSASLNTAAIGAAMASAQLHQTQELVFRQNTLQKRIELFDQLMETPDADRTKLPIRTILLGDETASIAVARHLLLNGFYTSAIFFPTVARGKAGLRVCMTASHTEQQIQELCGAITAIKDSFLR